jgi:hypothetical protein
MPLYNERHWRPSIRPKNAYAGHRRGGGRGVEMLLGHLQRADVSCQRKRFVLVRLRRGQDTICVAVRPAWPTRPVADASCPPLAVVPCL